MTIFFFSFFSSSKAVFNYSLCFHLKVQQPPFKAHHQETRKLSLRYSFFHKGSNLDFTAHCIVFFEFWSLELFPLQPRKVRYFHSCNPQETAILSMNITIDCGNMLGLPLRPNIIHSVEFLQLSPYVCSYC